MAAFRFLSAVMLLAAVVAFVNDLTPAIYGAEGFEATSVASHWKQMAPSSLTAAEATLNQTVGEWAWNTLTWIVLAWPTFVVFGVLAAICGVFGRRRRQMEIFVN